MTATKLWFRCCVTILAIFSVTVKARSAEICEFRYWLDNDEPTTISISSGEPIIIPYSQSRSESFGIINYQIKDSDGNWSVPHRYYFMPPENCRASVPDNLTLRLSSRRGDVVIEESVNKAQKEAYIDITGLIPGMHNLTASLNNPANGELLGLTNDFTDIRYNTPLPDNLALVLSSHRGNVVIQKPISKGQKEIDLDVKDLDPGIYDMTVSISNPENGNLIGLTNVFSEIKPFGGNTLQCIYYWLNDSTAQMVTQNCYDRPIPLSMTTDLTIDSRSIPSLDNKLTILDGNPHIAPNYEISVAFKNSSKFITDHSTSWITDNSRRVELQATQLSGSTQHDTDRWITDSCYWYQFNAIEGDNVSLSTRLRCKVKLYSPSAELVETDTFTFDKLEMSKLLEETGTYYVQLSEIEPSRREFSVLLTYLSGPTASDLNSGHYDHTHDGILLDWDNASEWKISDESVSLSKRGIDVTATNIDGNITPYITEKTKQCRVYPGNTLWVKSKDYIEKVVFCVQDIPGLVLPRINSTNGIVRIDSLTNCVEWSGLSNQVELSISSGTSDTDLVLPIKQIYVTLSELSYDDVQFEIADDYTGAETPYNKLFIWRDNKVLASHTINESSRLYFTNDHLIVNCDDNSQSYPLDKKLILTYEYSDTPGTDLIEDPSIIIRDGRIMLNSLPAFVGIYSSNGYTYYAGYVNDPDFCYPLDRLSPGVYIVKVDEKISKIMIR